MTILPRWFQIGFLALAGIGLVYVFVMYVVFASNIDDVLDLDESAIDVIVLFQSKERSTEIPRDAWNAIRGELGHSRRVFFAGSKGEKWTYFCTLLVRTKKSEIAYLLDLKTRPSMEGDIIFSLERGSMGSQWVYGNYQGGALLYHLQVAFPESCQPKPYR